jgi:hypothetical protein
MESRTIGLSVFLFLFLNMLKTLEMVKRKHVGVELASTDSE